MKKSGILLGILIVIGSITEVEAQCWIDKKDGYNYVTVGQIRPNSTENCGNDNAYGTAALLLLLDEPAN